MRAKLEARAAKRSLAPAVLIDEMVEQAMQKGPAYREEMAEIVRAINYAFIARAG